jgi:hypothetical protein
MRPQARHGRPENVRFVRGEVSRDALGERPPGGGAFRAAKRAWLRFSSDRSSALCKAFHKAEQRSPIEVFGRAGNGARADR